MTMCQTIQEILYYKPTRTGQKDSSTLSVGVSATWSKPLDKKLQEQCKQAADANIALMNQSTANKRLDFEIARLKNLENCGELYLNQEYAKVCADVVNKSSKSYSRYVMMQVY